LFVPFRHGYPLGAPKDPDGQRSVLEAALQILETPDLQPPALVEFQG
jgi:hypothetical protein